MSDIASIVQTWRVLIVEDAPDNAELVERVLKHFGAQVVTSINGAAALEQLRAADFTVVICDLAMPELDGWALISEMQGLERAKSTPVIALTAYAADEDRARVMKAGFAGYY